MNIAVRYYSRSGNTKLVAEAIAKEVGAQAISANAPDAPINEPVDVLFIGGALYAYGLDSNLKEYLKTLKKDNVKKAVVFSTSWISKHSIDLIKNELCEKGIEVDEEAFYVRNKPTSSQILKAADFARRHI